MLFRSKALQAGNAEKLASKYALLLQAKAVLAEQEKAAMTDENRGVD